MKNKRRTWCHLLFYFTSYVFNMFRTLICPSSGACGCVVESPHRSFFSEFVVCWRFGAAGFEWCSYCRVKHNCSVHVVCLAHKKWNKIASDIKFVFYSSTITKTHCPINITFHLVTYLKYSQTRTYIHFHRWGSVL